MRDLRLDSDEFYPCHYIVDGPLDPWAGITAPRGTDVNVHPDQAQKWERVLREFDEVQREMAAALR